MGHDANESLMYAPNDVWRINDNPYIGETIEVTWLRQWGGKPAGYSLKGELVRTFVVNGRTLIGELKVAAPDGYRIKSLPWSKNYLKVEVLT